MEKIYASDAKEGSKVSFDVWNNYRSLFCMRQKTIYVWMDANCSTDMVE